MFHNFSADHQVERTFTKLLEQVGVGGHQLEAALRVGLAGVHDARMTWIDSHDLAAETSEGAAGVAVTTSDIEYARPRPQAPGEPIDDGHEARVHVRRTGVMESVVAISFAQDVRPSVRGIIVKARSPS